MRRNQELVNIENKLKKCISYTFQKKQYEKCVCAIDLYGLLLYKTNQKYVDNKLDRILYDISKNVNNIKFPTQTETNLKYVLFYDGFGLETRGLALIYLKALVENNYNIIYVTRQKQKNRINDILKVLSQNDNNIVYFFKENSILGEYKKILTYLMQFNVTKVILYLQPNDIKGILIGYHYEQICDRFFVDLTDHAFWLGCNTFDYIIEFRDYGASIAKDYRKISPQKIVKIPYYPLIDESVPFEGFPYFSDEKKIIFSGGALYKTLGANNLYYDKIINYILSNHDETVFIYAGYGDDSELKKLQMKYPQRVFHLPERKDLYQMMKRSYIYISTYPMIGGLMTQYAIAANTVPLTLLYDECGKGILLNPGDAEIEFTDLASYLNEIDRCLNDEVYMNQKKEKLKNQIISKSLFDDEVDRVLQVKNGNYSINYEKLDTSNFRKEYMQRLNKYDWYDIIGNVKYWKLFKEFGKDWSIGICKKVRKILCK